MQNRGFLYGDGFFETIRVYNGQIPLIDAHIDRIEDALEIYEMDIQFDVTYEFITSIASQYAKNGSLRINFFRDGQGKYNPETNHVAFNHSFSEHNQPFYLPESLDLVEELKKAPYIPGTIGIYPEPKPNVPWMTVKSLSSIYYVLASKYKTINGFDHLLIQNGENLICEELISNIIILKEDELYVANRDSGGVDGATQRFLRSNYGFQMLEKPISK
ncbi:MAG: aminotransferase class IV, partial [Bacteroidia bacterium]